MAWQCAMPYFWVSFFDKKKNLDVSLLLKLIYIFCQVKGKKNSDFLTCYFSPFFAQWKKKSQEFTERHKKDSHEETLKCKLYVWWKKNPICQIFHQKSFTVWMRIDEIADVFLNSTNFSGSALISLYFNFPTLYFPYTLISLLFNFPTLIYLDYDFPIHRWLS